MDLLMKAAKAFESLLTKSYHIRGGKSQTILDIYIDFKKEDFFHLAGLHKLKDIDILNSAGISRMNIFDKILNGDITYQDISKSVFWNEVQNRVDNLHCLESWIDNENLFFRFYKKKVKGSSINAEYVFYFEYNHNKAYFFTVRRNKNEPQLCGCSFFISETNNYIIGQPRYTVIYKAKKCLLTQNETILVNKIKP